MKFSTSSDIIVRELNRHFTILARESSEVLRSTVTILTTGQDPVLKLPSSVKERLLLSCISWYLEDELGVLLRLKLEEEVNRFGPDYSIKLSLLLQSKGGMINYILESNVLGNTPQEVFGNILAIHPKIKVYPYKERKAKRLIRHRGYRDKGTLRLQHEYHGENESDWIDDQRQLDIEEQREIQQDTIQLLMGFLQP